jgi:hypothetical protein
LPDDAAYDHEAFNGFVEAIRSYLAEHPSFDSPRPAIRHRKCRPPLICTLVRQQQGAIVMVTKLARPLSLGGLCLNSGPSSRHAQEKSFMPAAPPISVH